MDAIERNMSGMRAVIMTRVSTRARAQEASPEIQERACRQFCEMYGLDVREVISETFTGRKVNYTDKNGKTHVREGLQRVFDLLERGLIDVVVFHKIDRISRQGEITREFAKGIYRRNGKVGVAVKGVIYDTFFKFRQQGLLDITVAEHEVLQLHWFWTRRTCSTSTPGCCQAEPNHPHPPPPG